MLTYSLHINCCKSHFRLAVHVHIGEHRPTSIFYYIGINSSSDTLSIVDAIETIKYFSKSIIRPYYDCKIIIMQQITRYYDEEH